jgi:hypothetical protein
MSVALTTLKELGELLGAVKDAGSDSKESDAPGPAGSQEGDASDT